MNALPESRRAIHGRTFDRRWRAADFDPVERPRRGLTATDAAGAVVVAVLAAVVILHALGALFV